MKETIDQLDLGLIKGFIEETFPKKRVRPTPKHRNFKRAIVIPATLNNGAPYIYQLSDKSNLDILFMQLYNILKEVFYGFHIDVINSALYEYLGITQS